MHLKYIFHERFSELVSQSNLTYEEIAKELGLKSKGTISKYASGQIQNIGPMMIDKIATLFNVSPIWLLGYTDNKHYKIKKN